MMWSQWNGRGQYRPSFCDISFADDTTLNAGSGGDVLRTLEDGSNIKWPVGVVAYATTVGTPDVLSIPVAAALADGTANPTTLLGGNCLMVYNGSTWDRASGDARTGQLVNLGVGHDDVFGRTLVSSANNDIDVQFFRGDPEDLVAVTTANSATAVANVGGALFSSSTNADGSVQGVSRQTTVYRSGSEVYCLFTAAFTAGIASSYMRLGLYDANEGFFIGYEGTSFGVTYRNNASDTTVAKASFSEDDLTGGAGSKFTRAGTAEAIDLTKLNVFRIRFGWLGSAPVYWEVMAPDGHWVTFHKTLFPNLQTTPSIRSADLPVTLDITKTTAAATDITIQTDCWGAGLAAGTNTASQDIYAFQTNTLLTASATYSSGVLALSPAYSQVQTTALASHDGTINIYWYRDAGGTDLVRTLTIAYTAANGFQMYAAPAFTPYVKYEWVNSGTNQTDFYFDTKFLRRALHPQILRVDGPLAGGMVASVSRSIVAAYNGTSYENIQSTAGNNLKVALQELSDGVDVGNGTVGAETQRVTIASDSTGLLAVQGEIAHDVAANTTNPLLLGAEARSSEGTAVVNGDLTRLMADFVGKLVTSPHAPSDLYWQNDGSKTDTTDLALAAAAGSGVRNYITDLIVTNASATDTTVILKDGSTEIARFPAPANGGVVHRFAIPMKTTANTALNIASAASVTTMYFAATGYTGR